MMVERISALHLDTQTNPSSYFTDLLGALLASFLEGDDGRTERVALLGHGRQQLPLLWAESGEKLDRRVQDGSVGIKWP